MYTMFMRLSEQSQLTIPSLQQDFYKIVQIVLSTRTLSVDLTRLWLIHMTR